MRDNDLIKLIADNLDAGSLKNGWGYFTVQKNQPTQEGTPSVGTLFVQKLFDVPYGFVMVKDVYDPEQDVFVERNTQLVETAIQVSALIPQDPTDIEIPTPSDVVNLLQIYMSSRSIMAGLRTYNVGILRVRVNQNPYFEDDKHRFEAYPSFDLVLTHDRWVEFDVPAVVKAVDDGVYPV